MEDFIHTLNAVIWSPALVAFCLGAGLFFSIKSRFVQLRLIPEMWRLLFQKKEDEIGLSSFQALSLTLAGRVGTGNIAGVATAICFGGPGALFWMWVVAFLGASSAFVESTLGQIYKERIEGQYRGGPAFYIERGLKLKAYAWAFAIVTILASCFFCPGVQSNSIALAWNEAFGLDAEVTAAIVASITCFDCRWSASHRHLYVLGRALHGSGLHRRSAHHRRCQLGADSCRDDADCQQCLRF